MKKGFDYRELHTPFTKQQLLDAKPPHKNNNEHKTRISIYQKNRSYFVSFYQDYKHIRTVKLNKYEVQKSIDSYVIVFNKFLKGNNFLMQGKKEVHRIEKVYQFNQADLDKIVSDWLKQQHPEITSTGYVQIDKTVIKSQECYIFKIRTDIIKDVVIDGKNV